MLSKAMASGLHLKPLHRQVIEDLAGRHLPGVEIWAYGSRVNGQSHEGSDLDLVLRGPKLAEIPSSQLGDFQEALQESTLPFLVEARDWARLPERFHGEIQRNYAVLVSKEGRWHNVTLGDCAVLVRDSITPSTCPDLPYIGLEHIGQGTLSLNGTGSARNVESTKSVFRTSDILFGKLRPYFRKVVQARFDGICSTDIWVVRPQQGVEAGYLFYLLASTSFVEFANQGAEGTRMPRAKWEHVQRFPLRLPPVSEQRAIAGILGALSDKIELNRRMIEIVERTVREIFESWFHGQCSVSPNMARLDDWIDLNPSYHLSQGDIAPYLDMANTPTRAHIPHAVTYRSYRSGTRFQNGDTLVARITPCLENGKAAYVDFLEEGEVGWGSTEFIVMRPKHPIPYEFAYCLARDESFRRFAILNMTGTSGRQRVSAESLATFPVPVPSPTACRQFGQCARPLFSKARAAAFESRSLASLRDTLLPKLLAGKIRILDAEKIVETAT